MVWINSQIFQIQNSQSSSNGLLFLFIGVPDANTNPQGSGIHNLNLFRISEIKIKYDPKISPSDLPKVSSSDTAHNVFRSHWKDDIKHVESFYILLLNRANRAVGIKHISTGGLAGTVADPKVIMQTALKANASSVILCHNHPSDSIKPSQNDIDLTEKLKSAGDLLDIQVLDHLILGWESYYSFADEGLM